MHKFEKMIKYPLKKRKRCLFSAICCVMIVYGAVQLLYLHDDYSPLQLLSSVESEAARLLRFVGQVQVQCNNSLATNNASTWMLCQESELGMGGLSNDEGNIIVYSIGPSSDYSFEMIVSRNFTSQLFVFSHLASKLEFLSRANPKTVNIYQTSIVANDPADFARNSFDTQTLNSVMANLGHKEIDMLKIDTLVESVHSYEVLRFLISDSLLQRVKELHIVLKLDKVEEDYIYSWYRVLYALFHKAGFRLYHTAASDPLCLQDTVMESCKYFLSWIRHPPPHVFVLYPPAIDGSYEFEKERMFTFLDETSSRDSPFLPLKLDLNPTSRAGGRGHASHRKTISLELSQRVIKKDAHSCSIILIVDKSYQHFSEPDMGQTADCHIHLFVYIPPSTSSSSPQFLPLSSDASESQRISEAVTLGSIMHILTSSTANILYIELRQAWDLISLLSSMEVPKFIDQLIIKTSIFPSIGRPQPMVLRRRYSELKRLQEFQLLLMLSDKSLPKDLKYDAEQDIYRLNFVKSILL